MKVFISDVKVLGRSHYDPMWGHLYLTGYTVWTGLEGIHDEKVAVVFLGPVSATLWNHVVKSLPQATISFVDHPDELEIL